MWKAVAALAMAFALGGCANMNQVVNDVSTYSAWPADRKPGSYAFERLPSARRDALVQAAGRIRMYHERQVQDSWSFTDADGTRPHFVRWLQENEPHMAAGWKKLDDTFYSYWGSMPYEMPGGEGE